MKSEPKTMRFDYDVEEYINAFGGLNFSERFHNMVRWFISLEDEKKKRIELLDKQIEEKEKRLSELFDFLNDSKWIENHFRDLKRSIDSCKGYLDNFVIQDIRSGRLGSGKNVLQSEL